VTNLGSAARLDVDAIRAHNAQLLDVYLQTLSAAPQPADTVSAPAVDIVRDVVFRRIGDIELRLDLYLPEDLHRPTPVIVWISGGGWRMQRRGVSPSLTRLFTQRGYAMVDIEYRSTAVEAWPAQLDDVRDAVQFVVSIAEECRIDASSIGLWGSSAGGHLALMAAFGSVGPGRRQMPPIGAVVAGCAPSDLLTLDADALPGGLLSDVDSRDPSWGLLGGRPASRPHAARAASPVHQVRAGVPPTFLLHGDNDLLVGPLQSRRLFEALADAGAEAHYALVHRAGHGFLSSAAWEETPYRVVLRSSSDEPERVRHLRLTPALIERFFDRHLRKEPWNA
jgi:acetyl esterase/lipase